MRFEIILYFLYILFTFKIQNQIISSISQFSLSFFHISIYLFLNEQIFLTSFLYEQKRNHFPTRFLMLQVNQLKYIYCKNESSR